MRRLIVVLIRAAQIIMQSISWQIWRLRLRSIGKGARVFSTVKIYAASKGTIGANVVVNDFVHVWGGGGLSIGDNTLIASHVVITTTTHDIAALSKGKLYNHSNIMDPVIIGSNVWIGSGAIILPGVTVGDNSVVAAGSIVTRDVPSCSLVVGIPARPVRRLDIGIA